MRKGCSAKLRIVRSLSPSRCRTSMKPWGTASWSVTTATGSGTGIEAEGDTLERKKSKPKSPFLRRWRIVTTSTWEDEYLDEEVQAFFEIEETGSGSFQFGYIQGLMDSHTSSRGGKPAVEFS
jgi:hypothetical protein